MRKYRSKFIEETLWGFLTDLNESGFTPEELNEIQQDRSMKSRIRYRVGTVKWYVKIYLALPLDAVITIPYVLLGGARRYDEYMVEQFRGVLPEQIVDEALRNVQCIPDRQLIRGSFKDIWGKVTKVPVVLRYCLDIAGYYLIQDVLGPMVYWPLFLFRRPICAAIKTVRRLLAI